MTYDTEQYRGRNFSLVILVRGYSIVVFVFFFGFVEIKETAAVDQTIAVSHGSKSVIYGGQIPVCNVFIISVDILWNNSASAALIDIELAELGGYFCFIICESFTGSRAICKVLSSLRNVSDKFFVDVDLVRIGHHIIGSITVIMLETSDSSALPDRLDTSSPVSLVFKIQSSSDISFIHCVLLCYKFAWDFRFVSFGYSRWGEG